MESVSLEYIMYETDYVTAPVFLGEIYRIGNSSKGGPRRDVLSAF